MEHFAMHKLSKIHNSLLSKISDRLCCDNSNSVTYFYHSDHLGSASWITNKSGNPVQHLQYMPYGEPLVNERTSSYEERFTFTGKERDSETGFSYFGARYYDSDILTAWLSVDPMADKYPSLSPYAYCAWNPVRLVDPDGEEMTKFEDENGKLLYETKDGSNAVFRLTERGKSGSAYFKLDRFEDSQGGHDVVNFNTLIDYSQEYTRNTYTNEDNGTTYCNFAARFIAKSFVNAAKDCDFDVPDISFLNNKASKIYSEIPNEYLINGGDATATTKAKATIKGQHLSLVFASSPSHILSFTTDGNYSNIGGSTGNHVQKYHWLKDIQGIKYFSLDVILYKSKPIIKSDE